MDSLTKRKISFKSSPITYTLIENPEKETIVMLHPAFADQQLFQAQIEFFKDDYQIVLIDMPGHGENQLHGAKVILAEMPEILSQILFENNITSCHLLGVSLGSLVAQAFADRYPAQVKSVIIVGGYSIHKANERILKAQKKEGLKWGLYLLFSMKKFRKYVVSVSCHTEHGRHVFDRAIQKFSRRSFAAMSGMNSFFINKNNPVPYPLMIIVGEHDLELAKGAAIELHQLESHSQYAYLQKAGHCANVDSPHEFNEVMKAFLS